MDEIQYVKAWESEIKLIYDQFPKVKFVLTGSLSLSYKRRMEESLAGRFLPKYLYPLDFTEYLDFIDHPLYSKFQSEPDLIDQKILAASTSNDFNNFLYTGRYPETIKMTSKDCKYYLNTLQFQCLNQDTLNYFKIDRLNLLQNLFDYFKANNGCETSFAKLSQIVGGSQETISKYVDVLHLLRLIYIVQNTNNPLKTTNSNKKIYTNSAFSLNSDFVSKIDNLGQAAESYVLEKMLQNDENISYFRQRNEEIDFISWSKNFKGQKGLGVEVKYRQKIKADDYKNLVKICTKLSLQPKLITINATEVADSSIITKPIIFL